MSCKCKKSAECEECPEWIFTFADLVMLMMGFFVILWVLKPAPGKDSPRQEEEQAKFDAMVMGIRESFGYVPSPFSQDPVEMRMRNHQRAGMRQGAESDTPRESPAGTDHEPTNIRPGKQSSVGGHMVFAASSTELNGSTKASLDQIAERIKGHRQIVVVKGFASLDDYPEGSPSQVFRDLSIRRAVAAEDYLIERGVQPELISISVHSTYEPVRQHSYGTDGQSENRRVEIEVTSSLLEERQSGAQTTPADPSLSGKSEIRSGAE